MRRVQPHPPIERAELARSGRHDARFQNFSHDGRVRELLPPELSVAAVNGPAAVLVSGPAAALDRLLGRCEERGVRARRIAVGYASHSPQMNRLVGRLLADLAPVTPGPAGITLISTLTGEPADGTGLGAEYWVDNLRRTAGCAAAVRPRSPGAHGSERPVADDMVVSWNTAETIVEVPGNHWTMMRRYADSTARAVDEWLSSRFDADVSERGESGLFARNLSGVAEESRRQHD